jgi:hypothetical protein
VCGGSNEPELRFLKVNLDRAPVAGDDFEPDVFSSASLEAMLELVRNMFLCSLVWSVGGLLDRGDRPKFDAWLRRKIPAGLPGTSVGENDSIFNWMFDVNALEWQRFQVPEFSFPKQVRPVVCSLHTRDVFPFCLFSASKDLCVNFRDMLSCV